MVETKKPIKNYKAGALTLSMWENKLEATSQINEVNEGLEIVSKKNFLNKIISFSIQRSYKDKEDNWQHTTNLRTQDLPKLQLLLNKAYEEQTLS